VLPSDPLRLSLLLAPLLAVGAAAGVLRGLAQRAPDGSRRRRTLSAGWVLLLLAATPLWLILAAVLGVW
jgi:hypothetical protein